MAPCCARDDRVNSRRDTTARAIRTLRARPTRRSPALRLLMQLSGGSLRADTGRLSGSQQLDEPRACVAVAGVGERLQFGDGRVIAAFDE